MVPDHFCASPHPFFIFIFYTEWSGINALLYYGPTLVKEIGLKGDTVSLVVSGGIGIVQFIAVLPAIAYIDKVGRKALLRGACLSRFTIPPTRALSRGLRITITVVVPGWT